jgi:PQQ-like domain
LARLGAAHTTLSTVASPDTERPASRQVLDDYVARMRHLRRWYFAAVVALVVVAVVVAEVVLGHGEIARAHLHSAKSAAAAPPTGGPSATVSPAWESSDASALGQPGWAGTVVTYSAHTVTGRNYRTGAGVWSYTRTDFTICAVIQEQGQTVAFFDHSGNCDEVSAFDTGTGARIWYRTLDANGLPINGHPSYQFNQYTALVTTPTEVEALSLSAPRGIDRWDFAQPSGCTTTGVALGADGVLIAQHCGDGYHLLLRDAYAGNDDKKPDSPVKWRLNDVRAVPVSADALITAFDSRDGSLVSYRAKDGGVLTTTSLTPKPDLRSPISAISTTTELLVSAGTSCYAIGASAASQIWSLPLAGPLALGSSVLVAAMPGAVGVLNGAAGTIAQAVEVAAAKPGRPAYPVGSGFLIGGSTTAVYLH